MAVNKKKKKSQRVHSSFLTKLTILVLIAAVGWQLYSLQGQVAAAETKKADVAAQVEDLRQKNEALEADLEEGTTDQMMEEIARQELGLVTPGEYVFYDVSN